MCQLASPAYGADKTQAGILNIGSKKPSQSPRQPLAGVMSTFDFMKQFSMFATLAPTSGGSAPSRSLDVDEVQCHEYVNAKGGR
jgi:hypothetical protein